MADMLVKLYTLPELAPVLTDLRTRGVLIRKANATERYVVADWVRQHFAESWALAADIATGFQSGNCYIAVEPDAAHTPTDAYDLPSETMLGFACFDVDVKGMFGPIGVREDQRNRGIGKGLLLACLHAMAADKYAYAIIGWVGPVEFYVDAVGATMIEDSEPGIFRGGLKI